MKFALQCTYGRVEQTSEVIRHTNCAKWWVMMRTGIKNHCDRGPSFFFINMPHTNITVWKSL